VLVVVLHINVYLVVLTLTVNPHSSFHLPNFQCSLIMTLNGQKLVGSNIQECLPKYKLYFTVKYQCLLI
jgi:hypothetical protein